MPKFEVKRNRNYIVLEQDEINHIIKEAIEKDTAHRVTTVEIYHGTYNTNARIELKFDDEK